MTPKAGAQTASFPTREESYFSEPSIVNYYCGTDVVYSVGLLGTEMEIPAEEEG
jgi:hypothetical protein